MSKELEALENLYRYLEDEYEFRGAMNDIDEQKNIIETALKDYERMLSLGLKNINEIYPKAILSTIDLDKIKAFEIIKEKRGNVELLYEFWEEDDEEFVLENYNMNSDIELTQEEYELLKKVLL